jgi:hypothetical protein
MIIDPPPPPPIAQSQDSAVNLPNDTPTALPTPPSDAEMTYENISAPAAVDNLDLDDVDPMLRKS